MNDFKEFPKIARLNRDIIVTEKIDGTNAQVFIVPTPEMPLAELPVTTYACGHALIAGSRNRWITPENDNFGFASWVRDHASELTKALGPGRHYGEWWGRGIHRGYGLPDKRFSLFNATRWHVAGGVPVETRSADPRTPPKFSSEVPEFLSVVPVLYRGPFDTAEIARVNDELAQHGSVAAPGFMDPEGVVAYHVAGGVSFKVTIKGDAVPKTLARARGEK